MALARRPFEAFRIDLPHLCCHLEGKRAAAALRRGFSVAQGSRLLLFSREGEYLAGFPGGRHEPGHDPRLQELAGREGLDLFVVLDVPFSWRVGPVGVHCADGMPGTIEATLELRLQAAERLVERTAGRGDWGLRDLEDVLLRPVDAALPSAARGREAAELLDYGEALRALLKRALLDTIRGELDRFGLELVAVPAASFRCEAQERLDKVRAGAEEEARRVEIEKRRLEARNGLLQMLARQKEAEFTLEEKERELIVRAERERLLRDEEIVALKAVREARDEERRMRLQHARERLELEQRLDLLRMKTAFAQEVRERKLRLDREHLQKLLEGGAASSPGLLGPVVRGLVPLGVPVGEARVWQVLDRGDLPSEAMPSEASAAACSRFPVGLQLCVGDCCRAGRRSLIRFRLVNFTDERLQGHLRAEVHDLELQLDAPVTLSCAQGGVPFDLPARGDAWVPFRFLAEKAGSYTLNGVELEVRRVGGERCWLGVPPNVYTVDVSDGGQAQIVVNAEVVAGDIHGNVASEGVTGVAGLVDLPLGELPPPLGAGLPPRLRVLGPCDRTGVSRLVLDIDPSGEDARDGPPRRYFLFGGDRIELGKQPPGEGLIVRHPKHPRKSYPRGELNNYISRSHAALEIEPGGHRLWLEDRCSTNGTFLLPAAEDGTHGEGERRLKRGSREVLGDAASFRLSGMNTAFSVVFRVKAVRARDAHRRMTSVRLMRTDRDDHGYLLVSRRAFVGRERRATIRVDAPLRADALVLEWRQEGFVAGPGCREADVVVAGKRLEFGEGVLVGSATEIRMNGLRARLRPALDGDFKEPVG